MVLSFLSRTRLVACAARSAMTPINPVGRSSARSEAATVLLPGDRCPTGRGDLARSAQNPSRNSSERGTKPHGTVTAKHWDRIEEDARERNTSPNQIVVQLAIEPLDRREWPRTEAQTKAAGPRFSSPRPSPEVSSPTATNTKFRKSENLSRRSSPILAASPIPSTPRLDLRRSDKQMHTPPFRTPAQRHSGFTNLANTEWLGLLS